MRYVASEKLEIIRLVEESHLSARLTLAKLGIPRTTFYRWYDRYLQRGEAGLQDQSPKPRHVWNRIPDVVRRKVVKSPNRGLCRSLQPPTLPREPEQRHTLRRILRTRQSHSTTKGKDQTKDTRNAALASQTTRRIM